MSKRIAIFGGSFNPPGIHHRLIAESLAREFDEVVIVPCGPRPDKQTTNDVEPIHRAAMTDMTFRDLRGVRVELFDLENATFTRTHELEARFQREGEVWHIVGSDLIQNGSSGRSVIHHEWERGPQVWTNFRFGIVPRSDFDFTESDLPPHSHVFHDSYPGSSSQIRENVFRHLAIEGFVMPDVADHIERYGIYHGRPPARTTMMNLKSPGIMVIADEHNPRCQELSARVASFVDDNRPNLIVVIGGDGTMLRAIRQHWRRRLPFLGINAGHRGFLLNNSDNVFSPRASAFGELTLHQLPLLYAEITDTKGQCKRCLAFNETWIERETGQAAWIEVRVNGVARVPKMVCDGALISTAAGSTAYARAMGATPLLVDSPALLLVGSNVMEPPSWKSAHLSLDARVELINLHPEKRPMRAFTDGVNQGEIVTLRARISRIAAAELAFFPEHDMTEKLSQIQFPIGIP